MFGRDMVSAKHECNITEAWGRQLQQVRGRATGQRIMRVKPAQLNSKFGTTMSQHVTAQFTRWF